MRSLHVHGGSGRGMLAYLRLQSTTCTSTPCEWIQPSAQKITYATSADIEFISPRRKLKRVSCTSPAAERACKQPTPASLVSPTADEAAAFYSSLAASGARCSVLAIVAPYSEAYVPRAITHKLPPPLPDVLLDDGFVRKDDFAELKAACSVTFAAMSITSEETVAIELETRGQSSTNSWFRYRAGRITASNFRAAIRTQTANPNNLARSLIKRICYPGSYKFTLAATNWGCSHESAAVSAYRTITMDSHRDFSLVPSPGVHINPRFPHLGASPDALAECSCHGMGILEVKCPHCRRTSLVDDAADDPHFYLHKRPDGTLCLKPTHEYYYQVQAQLFVTGRTYCDFVVFTGTGNLFVQRLVPDTEFWSQNISIVDRFYVGGILPELIGKWYSRTTACTSDLSPDTLICYCRQPPTATDILDCIEALCKVKRYHRECLGLKKVPKRAWHCLDCRKQDKATARSARQYSDTGIL